jgi:hypothetical protein
MPITYAAFYASYPTYEAQLLDYPNCLGTNCKYPIDAGDVISASVECISACTPNDPNQKWHLWMRNATKNWNWSTDYSNSTTLTYAAWIMEASADHSDQGHIVIPPLANYGSITFTGLSVNGLRPDLPPADAIIMNDQAGGVSRPCIYNPQISQFTIMYGGA